MEDALRLGHAALRSNRSIDRLAFWPEVGTRRHLWLVERLRQGRSPWWAMNTFSFRPQGERMLPGTKSLGGNEQLLFPPGGRTSVARDEVPAGQ